jgi:hypothetical protein
MDKDDFLMGLLVVGLFAGLLFGGTLVYQAIWNSLWGAQLTYWDAMWLNFFDVPIIAGAFLKKR